MLRTTPGGMPTRPSIAPSGRSSTATSTRAAPRTSRCPRGGSASRCGGGAGVGGGGAAGAAPAAGARGGGGGGGGGPGWGWGRADVPVPAGGRVVHRVVLERLADLPAQGWWSGDLHVHMNYGGAYRNTPRRLAFQAHAEDLHVVENLIVNKEGRVPDIGYFT